MSIKEKIKVPREEVDIINYDAKALCEERDVLWAKVNKIRDNLYRLCEEKNILIERKRALSMRNSPFATTLKEKIKNEIEQIESERARYQKEKEKIESQLEKIPGRIRKLYIQEQTKEIVAKFLEYMECHIEEIACNLKTTFIIACENKYGGYCLPTGNMGIFYDKEGIWITKAKDFSFYFNEDLDHIELYHIEYEYNGDCKHSRVIYTKWYQHYFQDFVNAIGEELQRNYHNYPYSDSFKLTIEDQYITLELE